MHGVLRTMGIRAPRSRARVVIDFVGLRAKLALRGLELDERAASDVSSNALEQIDACTAAASTLGFADPLEGAVYQTRALLLALDAGELHRVTRLLALEAGFRSVSGIDGYTRALELLRTAEGYAARSGEPTLQASIDMVRAMAEFQVGHWRASNEAARRAYRASREMGRGWSWERRTSQSFLMLSNVFLGELSEAFEQAVTILVDAQRRRDREAATVPSLPMEIHRFLIKDDPDRATTDVHAVMEDLPQQAFSLQANYGQRALAQIDMYRGDGHTALSRLERLIHDLRMTGLSRVAIVWSLALESRLRALLMIAAGSSDPTWTDMAESAVSRLQMLGFDWTKAQAVLGRAQLACLAGRSSEADELLQRACDLFDAADMKLHASAVRWRLGELRGGREGDEVSAWMADEGARDPEAIVRMLVPVPITR